MVKKRKSRYAKNKKNRLAPVLIAIAVILLIALACMIGFVEKNDGWDKPTEPSGHPEATNDILSTGPDDQSANDAENTSAVQTEAPKPESVIPCTLENGKLEITSLFPYTGINPDSNWTEGEDIGAIVLTNKSNEHLASAKLKLVLYDGTVLEFQVAELPAGETVWAFDLNNSIYDVSAACESIECTVQFEPETSLMADRLTVEVAGMDVTLTNTSSDTMENVTIICHSVLGDAYFGGTAYTYSAGEVPAGKAVNVLAEDCFLDTAEVVRITSE